MGPEHFDIPLSQPSGLGQSPALQGFPTTVRINGNAKSRLTGVLYSLFQWFGGLVIWILGSCGEMAVGQNQWDSILG